MHLRENAFVRYRFKWSGSTCIRRLYFCVLCEWVYENSVSAGYWLNIILLVNHSGCFFVYRFNSLGKRDVGENAYMRNLIYWLLGIWRTFWFLTFKKNVVSDLSCDVFCCLLNSAYLFWIYFKSSWERIFLFKRANIAPNCTI